MRISIVNQYFPPDTSATAEVFSDLTTALLSAGHEVEVICGRPSYNPSKRMRWLPWRTERQSSMKVVRVGSTTFQRMNRWARPINYISYLALAGLRSSVAPVADVVVAGTDPPLAIWVALLRSRGRPVIYSVQDLHPEAALAAGMLRPGWLFRFWQWCHVMALRRVTVLVCLGKDMAARLHEKGVATRAIRVIANGSRRPVGEVDPDVVEGLRAGHGFVAMHAGNLGGAGAWETLVSAARTIPRNEIRLLFVGDGAVANDLRKAGAEVVPYRPESQLPSVMAAGDIQLVTMKPGTEGLLLPSKLYSILAHGRPVLAVVPPNTEVADIVESTGSGLVADAASPNDVVEKLLWAKSNKRALQAMAKAAADAGRDFDRVECCKEMVRLIEEIGGAAYLG